jgi:hypothetical protein
MRPPNLTNSLVWLGIVVLGASFYVPYWTAGRVARAEDRALDASKELLALALELEPDLGDPVQVQAIVDAFGDWAVAENLPEAWLPERITIRNPDGPTPPGVTLRMKHYMLRLSRTPLELWTPIEGEERPDSSEVPTGSTPDDREETGDDGATGQDDESTTDRPADWPTEEEAAEKEPPPPPREPFEVHAWPAGNLGAGYTIFYVPELGPAVYSRNKAAKFQGTKKVPLPGDGQPRPGADGLAPPPRREGTYRGRNDERWIVLPDDPPPR